MYLHKANSVLTIQLVLQAMRKPQAIVKARQQCHNSCKAHTELGTMHPHAVLLATVLLLFILITSAYVMCSHNTDIMNMIYWGYDALVW